MSTSAIGAGTIRDEGTLRSLFGLTPAEAVLTRLVAQGVTLEEAAARLGLRLETVRTRLKTIFGKDRYAPAGRSGSLGSPYCLTALEEARLDR